MNLHWKILLVSVLVPVSVTAQVARTSLNGTVTDEQGKRIPSARVQAINTATGLRRETDTNPLGGYVLAGMETGHIPHRDLEGRLRALALFATSSWESGSREPWTPR